VFNPCDDRIVRIQQLRSSQPDRRQRNRVERHNLGDKRVIVNTRRHLLAATMRCRHFHLPALFLQHATAGAFLNAHLSVWHHAGNCRGEASHQQQNQHTELAKNSHSLHKIVLLNGLLEQPIDARDEEIRENEVRPPQGKLTAEEDRPMPTGFVVECNHCQTSFGR
jgi:hypothetical protein